MKRFAKALAVLAAVASVAAPVASAFAAPQDGERLGEGRPAYNVRRGMYERNGGADHHVRPGMYRKDGGASREDARR